jgi:class 3 adenylate cyclase
MHPQSSPACARPRRCTALIPCQTMKNQWVFTVLNPPHGGPDEPIKTSEKTVIIGRIPEADIRLPWDNKVSRLHAKIDISEGTPKLTDLRSANGTFVLNRKKWRRISGVKAVSLPLELKLGDTRVRVDYRTMQESTAEVIPTDLLLSTPQLLDGKKRVEAIMVLDLCGSSALADRSGDQVAYHLKKRLAAICDSVFTEHKPQYTKNTGDGFFATFQNAGACLSAAVLVLRRLDLRNRNTRNPPIDVRIGLHFGETFLMDEETLDRHGNDLNIAFRIEGVREDSFSPPPQTPLPEKNRIVMSKDFINALTHDSGSYARLGNARLKGIQNPLELYLYCDQMDGHAAFSSTVPAK